MSRSSWADMDCSVAQTLEVIGEWWTLLILRNAFHGMHKFDDFQKQLGISTSVLSARLKKLTDAGVLSRHSSEHDGRSVEYRLTEKGLELYPVMISLKQWGDKWRPNGRGLRLDLRDRKTGRRIAGAQVLSAEGTPLDPRDVEVRPGPGADRSTRSLIAHRGHAPPSQPPED
ncbi:MAG: helix-turn-helix domain-containing protein [Myxococcota bacterium]